jgi:rare lipoprotein A
MTGRRGRPRATRIRGAQVAGRAIGIAGALWILAGCSTASPPREPTVGVPPLPDGRVHTGRASWYGEAHHGKQTASGERYDMNAMTAAHRALPLGTWLLVENPRNGKSVRVRVNDRGPYTDGRVLDLSLAAARALGAVGEGVIRVRYRVIDQPQSRE